MAANQATPEKAHYVSPAIVTRDNSKVLYSMGKFLCSFDTRTEQFGEWATAHSAPVRVLCEVQKDNIVGVNGADKENMSNGANNGANGHPSSSSSVQYATGGDDKKLVLWNGEFKQVLTYTHAKKITCGVFAPCNTMIVFGDKFGDVYSYNVKTSEVTLLFGHLAIITAVCFVKSEAGKWYLVTADNHEKIQVSSWPNYYVIQNFCLGHEGHITKMCGLEGDQLVSLGADGKLIVWNFLTGEEKERHVLGDVPTEICRINGKFYVNSNTGSQLKTEGKKDLQSGIVSMLYNTTGDEAILAEGTSSDQYYVNPVSGQLVKICSQGSITNLGYPPEVEKNQKEKWYKYFKGDKDDE